MSAREFFTKELNRLIATKDTDVITLDDVAHTLTGHDALDDYDWIFPPRGTVDVTRADGEIMRAILHYDLETFEPTGWATAQGPSVDELQSEDGGTSENPEQVVRDLHAAVLAWLDRCDT